MFSCTSLGDGKYYLNSDLEVECWSSQHLTWSLTLALPGILIWGILLPCLGVRKLYKNRANLHDPSLLAQYGFLFKGFNDQYYFWELIILFRKVAVASAIVFLYFLPRTIQALLCFAIILIAYRAQEDYHPYINSTLNSLEVRSLLVSLVTIYCGLFFLTDDVDRESQIMLLIVIVVVNMYFFLYWMKCVLANFPRYLKKKNPALYSKLCLMHGGRTRIQAHPGAFDQGNLKKVETSDLEASWMKLKPEESIVKDQTQTPSLFLDEYEKRRDSQLTNRRGSYIDSERHLGLRSSKESDRNLLENSQLGDSSINENVLPDINAKKKTNNWVEN